MKLVDLLVSMTRQEWRPRDVRGKEEEEEEEKRGVVVMNRGGQPYLASLLLLCGIRRTLGSLDDDAGHLANHLDELCWLYGVRMHGLATGAATLLSQRLSRRTEGEQIDPTEGSSYLPSRW